MDSPHFDERFVQSALRIFPLLSNMLEDMADPICFVTWGRTFQSYLKAATVLFRWRRAGCPRIEWSLDGRGLEEAILKACKSLSTF